MDGVDPGPRGSPREYVLLRAAQRRETLEHMRFVTLMKALNIDYKERTQVNELNNLINQYFDVYEPNRLVERKKFTESKESVFASFSKFFSKQVSDAKKTKKQPPQKKANKKSFEKL